MQTSRHDMWYQAKCLLKLPDFCSEHQLMVDRMKISCIILNVKTLCAGTQASSVALCLLLLHFLPPQLRGRVKRTGGKRRIQTRTVSSGRPVLDSSCNGCICECCWRMRMLVTNLAPLVSLIDQSEPNDASHASYWIIQELLSSAYGIVSPKSAQDVYDHGKGCVREVHIVCCTMTMFA